MKKTGIKVQLMLIFGIFLIVCLAGCQGGYTKVVKLEFDGQTRSYRLHIPSAYSSKSVYPFVLVLHGGSGNAEKIEKNTGMSDKSDTEGFIVAYPNGTGRVRDVYVWNAGFCCGSAYEENVDDVGFIKALINDVKSSYGIDPDRIYSTGFSTGGMMTHRLGSELSDLIAAIAPVSGAYGGKFLATSPFYTIPEPEKNIPVIAFHGKEDEVVPYEGGLPPREVTGNAYSFASVADAVEAWVSFNENSGVAEETTSANGNIIEKRYSDGSNNADVVLYTIVDGLHAWPGAKWVGPRGDQPTYDISATDIIWDFFKNHPKN